METGEMHGDGASITVIRHGRGGPLRRRRAHVGRRHGLDRGSIWRWRERPCVMHRVRGCRGWGVLRTERDLFVQGAKTGHFVLGYGQASLVLLVLRLQFTDAIYSCET